MQKIVMVLFICIESIVGYGQSVEEVLRNYENNHIGSFSIRLRNETVVRYRHSKSMNMMYSFIDQEYITDGDRIEMTSYSWHDLTRENFEAKIDQPVQSRFPNSLCHKTSIVWDGERSYEFGERELEGGGTRYGTVFISDNIEQAREDKHRAKIFAFQDGAFVGYIEGETDHFINILRHAKDLSIPTEMSELDGKKCVIVQATTESGKYKVWFAPDYDYNVMRLELTKCVGDKAYGYIVGEEPEPDPKFAKKLEQKGLFVPRQRKQVDLILSDITLKEIDGKWLPVAGVFYRKDIYKDGEFEERWHEIRRVLIDLKPDFMELNAFKPKIHDGVKVFYKGMLRPVDYVWRNGEVVPDIDDVILDGLEKAYNQMVSELTNEKKHAKEQTSGFIQHLPDREASDMNRMDKVDKRSGDKQSGDIKQKGISYQQIVCLSLAAAVILAIGVWHLKRKSNAHI
jgi:hypothetical protein